MRIFVHGNLRQLSSFSVINRQLIVGLRRLGHEVHRFASDDVVPRRTNPAPPEVYLFNGHPWNARHAPGRANVFTLHYEHLSPDRELCGLAERLNAAFDLVLVPAPFVEPVLRAAGLRASVEVVPWGYDPGEFRPQSRPVALADAGQFVFLHLGAANHRKGIDLLLRAYLDEFSDADDVVLVIKEAFRHATYERWLHAIERRFLAGNRPGAPRIRWIRRDAASVAGYFTAADVGVFPHRGEAFGLPILECIASGRRVIVTEGSGPACFCTTQNSWRLRARHVRRRGRVELEPDVQHLRVLLRRAYACGKVGRSQAEETSATVRDRTWRATVDALDAALRRCLAGVGARSASRAVSSWARGMRRRPAPTPVVAYAFDSRGDAGWRKLCTEIDRALAARLPAYVAVPDPCRSPGSFAAPGVSASVAPVRTEPSGVCDWPASAVAAGSTPPATSHTTSALRARFASIQSPYPKMPRARSLNVSPAHGAPAREPRWSRPGRSRA